MSIHDLEEDIGPNVFFKAIFSFYSKRTILSGSGLKTFTRPVNENAVDTVKDRNGCFTAGAGQTVHEPVPVAIIQAIFVFRQ
ncbi:hypothetical protein [Oxalobacter formigenes]|uniref:hypothetical protein n=1 Tax=Oxalobacter formigenes TaxID=847 RepID=UPI00056735A6|nr:hypothetical protein [Oxalobacter formigenes]